MTAALAYEGSGRVALQRVVEVGSASGRVEFDMPVGILLEGQAGRAFYIEGGTDGGITPIDHACAADDAARVHRHLAGAGIAAAGGVCRAAEPCSAGAPAAGGIADAGRRAAAIDSSAKTLKAAPATHWADGVPGARPAGRPCLARNGSTLPTSAIGHQRTKLSYEALLCLIL